MSSIQSRKRPVQPSPRDRDARVLGIALATLPGFVLASPAEPVPTERVLGGVRVEAGLDEDSYRPRNPVSPKFTADLINIPQTVVVIGKELLRDQGVVTLSDALRNTPGITFTMGENGNTTAGDSISMRGFDTAGSIFLDGIRDLGAVTRDTFNTEQIEVVKGPSGSDNGRSAPTGYVNLSSKVPTLESATFASLSGGTDRRTRVTGDFNTAIESIDGAALRLNVMVDQGDTIGRDIAGSERWGIAPAFALGLGGTTRLYLNYVFLRQQNTPDGGLPTIGVTGYRSASTLGPNVVAAVSAAPAVDTSNFYGSRDDYEDVTANQFTVRFEHDLSANTTLRNTARHGRYTLDRVLTGVNTLGNLGTDAAPASPAVWTVSRSVQGRDEINDLLTNQTNLTTVLDTGAIEHTVSGGVEFIYERQRSRGRTLAGTAPAANLYAPDPDDPIPAMAYNGSVTDGDTTTAALYLFDTLKFSERWSLNAGVRFDHYQTDYSGVPATTTPATAATYLEGQGNLLTGKIGLIFKPAGNASVYALVGTSQLPPGGANFALNAPVPNATTGLIAINAPNLDPQEATNVELGTKWDLLDNRLVVTGAVFDTRNRNDLANQDPTTGIVSQFGERKVRGVEVSAAGLITPDWQVNAGLSHLDTEVSEGTATTTGAQLQFTPQLTFTSWTTYRLPSGLTVGGGARYVDSQFRNGGNAQATQANLGVNPSYWIVDLMASYAVNEKLTLQANGWNVGDEFFLASLNNGGSRYTLGTRRSFLVTANYRF